MPTGSGSEPRILRVVLETLRQAPGDVKKGIRWALLTWVMVMGLQVADVWGRRGPGVTAEILSVLLGTTGAVLVCLIGVLRSAVERRGPTIWATFYRQPESVGRLAVALPAIGFAAGALLASACAILVVRVALGTSSVLATFVMVFYGGFLWIAAMTVTDTTALLYRSAREQAEAAARADAAATEARFAALQSQMNPHFLFNALNTIAALVREDGAAAERTVTSLADVLRRTLQRTQQPLTTVDEEVSYVEAYLAVEQQRWRQRLRVIWEVEPDARPLTLPPMTLQPLVENALRHGIGDRLEGGTLTIHASRTAQGLRLRVSDDGGGFSGAAVEGTGLGNLRARLATLYGGAAGLTISSTPELTTVAIDLPIGGLACAS